MSPAIRGHVSRDALPVLDHLIQEEHAILLEGPRGSGKSTLLREIAATRDARVVSADLGQAASVPAVLAVSFDAFEAIRRLARQCETTAPDLFAAFISAAAAAADGRDAITAAPALASAAAGTATMVCAGTGM